MHRSTKSEKLPPCIRLASVGVSPAMMVLRTATCLLLAGLALGAARFLSDSPSEAPGPALAKSPARALERPRPEPVDRNRLPDDREMRSMDAEAWGRYFAEQDPAGRFPPELRDQVLSLAEELDAGVPTGEPMNEIDRSAYLLAIRSLLSGSGDGLRSEIPEGVRELFP